jgi:type VI secretion system protein ImpC
MPRPFDFGEIHLGVSASHETSPAVPDPETPFRVALLGDFSGRINRGLCETGTALASRPAILIDRDDFDEVLAKFGAAIELPIGIDGIPQTLRFSELDDFHPDRIFERAGIFQRIRKIRARLQDTVTFGEAAQDLGLRPGNQDSTKSREPGPPVHPDTPSPSLLASSNLLDDTIDQTEARSVAGRPHHRAPDELGEFVPRADPRQSEVISVIDRAISAQMRALLHIPAFQALEAAWRAVFFLVRGIETSPQLKLYLIDVSKAELAADLGSVQDLHSTGIYKLLFAKTIGVSGTEPWAAVVGNYTFGPGNEDAELLGRIVRIASAADAPFIAAGSPQLLGCASFSALPDIEDLPLTSVANGAPAWVALRRLREASYAGLAVPRFLLRLPYGRKTRPAESFDFEEMNQAPDHEDFLWANPAFACALLLARSFSDDGWGMRPGTHTEVDGLPLYVYEQDGESQLIPCGEVLLTEKSAERILESGLMPLVSLKGQDSVRLVGFQSIADPLRPLAGRWDG